ncbi:MAG TPA: phosphatidylserine decarboxylase family protein [Elusimicrobia bacterium]|nr:phosphatidylserine decarboxylase family protein [Elusimicrobiota bacterium]
MSIALEGLPFILAGIALAAAGYFVPRPYGPALAASGLLFACFCAYFFRNPERVTPDDPKLLFSPGDGRVLSVKKENPEGGDTIRIFLSIFDVHIQRAPCAGTVEDIRLLPGSFVAAMKDEAKLNARNIVKLQTPRGAVEVEQITGLIARRIRCWVKKGDPLQAGERYGLIQFGSQAALHLPPNAKARVQPGDRVAGGLTPVAEWKD